MSFVIHGLGTALPPGVVTQEEAVACARVLSGPAVRDARWLPGVYAQSGIRTRHQILGRPLVEDLLSGGRESGSPFLPNPDRTGGPTTAERMRIYAEEAGPMALRAAADAVAEAGFEPGSFTHLVTVSCTGFVAPGVDLALITGLGLRPTVERTHVGFMGCHGALNGLRVANAFTTADPAARVLVVAVELCSLHYHCGDDAEKAVANAIFADGAAAVVGTGGTGEHTHEPGEGAGSPYLAPAGRGRGRTASAASGPGEGAAQNNGCEDPLTRRVTALRGDLSPASGGEVGVIGSVHQPTGHAQGCATGLSPWSVVASGSCLIPNSAEAMGWTVGDEGFGMTLSRRIPALIARNVRPWVESWLRDNGLSPADVGSWAVHPGGPKILSAAEEGLGLPPDALAAAREVYAACGNMSSPTVLFVLDRLRRANAPRPCVALGFGPGLVAEAALLR